MTDFPPQKIGPAELTRIGSSGTVWFAAAQLVGLGCLVLAGCPVIGLTASAQTGTSR